MDQQRVEEKNEKEEQSEESESVTDRSEEEMSDMTIAFEWDKESAKNDDAKTYDPYFGMTIPSETEFSKNLEKEARNESWAEENKLHSCFTLDEESQPEMSIGKGEVETDKAEGNIREMDKNESSIDEKGGETKNSTTGEGGTETVREKQVGEDVTKLFQSIQDDPITREIGTGRNSSQLKERGGWLGGKQRENPNSRGTSRVDDRRGN